MDVWNHPTISQIPLQFVSRTDVSPLCTEVSGGPNQLTCGTGAFGGSGLGAIEKVVYRSVPTTLTGTPPAEGWIFTYQNFSRNGALTNLQNPTSYGITLASKMFAIPNSTGGCVDNSPQFLQEPYFVSCVGDAYEYNMNAVDADLDSLAISFGHPMDHYQTNPYNPPINPAPIPYETGFGPNTPTPGPGFNAGNVDAQLDANSGNLTFLSNNTGNFAIKTVTQSFRQGVLIAEVEREMQLIVQSCSGANNAPVIAGPFGGLFETTVNAGDLVNFNLSSTDVELLQDGSPQNNHLSVTGLLFGPNPTLPVGCAIAPCPTVDQVPLITMSQGVNTTFNWQTTCDHLVNPYGYIADVIPYHFVFKVQDDYCPIPKVKYATITVNVVNPNVIPATQINCIQTAPNGDVTLNWDPVVDPGASFSEYQIHSDQSGLIASIPTIGTSSFTYAAPGQDEHFSIAVASACFGNTLRYADSVSNIHLDLNNPLNGTAVLQWNQPTPTPLPGMNNYYHIYREYPVGNWTLYDSVPFAVTNYIDTITICSTDLGYQIVLPNSPCDYTSNIVTDLFEDMITPDIPTINHVSIDTSLNAVQLSWNQNYQPDTYGYVIYTLDANGFVVPIDTVWGISNTTYTHFTNVDLEALTYTVAAFDSCETSTVPPTFQTSAKALLNTSMFLNSNLNICAKQVTLDWSAYIGWPGIDHYEVYGRKQGETWSNFGSTTNTSFVVDVDEATTYCFVVEGFSSNGNTAFSNKTCIYIAVPGQPAYNYLQVATVDMEAVRLTHYVDVSVNIAEISIQREESNGNFIEIARVPVTGGTISYVDTDVDVQDESYTYRVQVIDSCFSFGEISNEARTILLRTQMDDVAKIMHLSWNPYHEFDGAILGYNVYRGVNGIFSGPPIATVPNGQYFYEDDVNDVISTGRICYKVEAIEAINTYGFSELSMSNEACNVLPPLIYIPNTFTPDGNEINNIFIPVISDFDPSDYEFVVFNRWGQPMFRTTDPQVGWDGMVNETGQMAATGTYLYMVILTDGNGLEIIKRGHVNLLK
jgi:gliding motility-associated-like protein